MLVYELDWFSMVKGGKMCLEIRFLGEVVVKIDCTAGTIDCHAHILSFHAW